MDAEFSEFSYGFALSYEIVAALGPDIVGAPLFPSLREESELGYDADFRSAGWPLFLQFKLADCLTRSNANYWSFYGSTFFRIAIGQSGKPRQHNLLCDLSRREDEVYYAAPIFYRQREFNRAFASARVLVESAMIPLNQLPEITDRQRHHITYHSTKPGFRWHSEESSYYHIPVSGQLWLEGLRERLSHPRELGRDYFVELRNALLDLIRDRIEQPDLWHEELELDLRDFTMSNVIRDVRYLLITYFGVEALILRPR